MTRSPSVRATDIVGIVPAAGSARRLAGAVEGSKEILPLPSLGRWNGADGAGPIRPKPVGSHLLDAMSLAGIARAIVVSRPEKRDIERTLGDGSALGAPRLEYLWIERSASVPETLSHGVRAAGESAIAVGFPDVLAEPRSALARLVERFRAGDADAVIGLFPTDRPDKADLVRVGDAGEVLEILHKPGPGTGLGLTWLLAVWSPRFSRRLLRFAADQDGPREREPQVSDVFAAALRAGMRIETVAFPGGSHLDVGTADDLERAQRGDPMIDA